MECRRFGERVTGYINECECEGESVRLRRAGLWEEGKEGREVKKGKRAEAEWMRIATGSRAN